MNTSAYLKPTNILVLIDPPAAMPCSVDPTATERSCPLPGFTIEISRLVCRTLQYDCRFVTASGAAASVYGQQEPTSGKWSGILGQLIENASKYDTATPRLTPTYDRSLAVDFTAPFYYEHLLLFTRQPRLIANVRALNLWAAFRWEVWFGVVALLFFAVMHFLSGDRRRSAAGDDRGADRDENAIAAILKRRASHLRCHCSYLLTVVLLLAILILTAAYTGFLFSNRVAQRELAPFVDFESFVSCVEDGRCVLATKDASYGYMTQFIEAGTSEAFRRLRTAAVGDRASNPIVHWPLDELLARIRNEQTYYLTALIWDIDFYYAAGVEQCEYYVIRPAMASSLSSFPLPKNSTRRREMDRLASSLAQFELIQGILNKYFRIYDNCAGNAADDVIPETTPDSMSFLMNVFILLGAGEAVAIGLIVIEIIYVRIWRKE